MKKNTIKAFTLVEMLIVIVIIGILIAALMPRMQSAQGRARDVARKNDLSQIQTAIVTSQQDKGQWPWTGSAQVIGVQDVKDDLLVAGMSSVPGDPLKSAEFKGLGTVTVTSGDYGYAILKRNGTQKGGFILMSKTEIEGGSNWVVCGDEYVAPTGAPTKGRINPDPVNGTDIRDIHPCTKLTKVAAQADCSTENADDCKYYNDGELRYIVTY